MKKKIINILLTLVMAVACTTIMSTLAFADIIPESDMLCFTAEEANSSVKLVKGIEAPDVSLQYKLNGGSWSDYNIGNTINLANKGDNILFRATSENNVMASGDSLSMSNHFVMTGKIAASGNVMSLLSLNCTSLESKDYCFAYLFCDCANLTQAPELPATTLAESCYKSMFDGCANLTQAPELSATTLAESCYESMFWECANLTQAPELPATTLANYCYSQMFCGCVNLTQAPKLPATTLATDCYYSMFRGCSSLGIDKENEKSDAKCYYDTPIFKITSDSMEQYCKSMLPDSSTPVSGVAYYQVAEHTLTYFTNEEDKKIVHYEKCEKCQHEIAQKHIFEPSDTEGMVRCKLCGYEHVHEKRIIKGKEPTCMEYGWKDYYECLGRNSCGKYFSDVDCKHEIEDLEAWKTGDGKVDKRHKGAEITQQDATASKDGLKAYWYCRFCDKYYEDDNGSFGTEIGGELALETWKTGDGKIPKTGTTHIHTLKFIEGQEPTCTEDGCKDYFQCKDAACNKYFEDPACGKEITNLANWKTGKGIKEKINHAAIKIPQQDATTEKNGIKEYYICKYCDKYFEDSACEKEITNLEEWKTGDGKIDKSPEAPTHLHTFANDWSKSSDYHWHLSTCCIGDGLVLGFGEHNYNEGTYEKGIKTSICETCGYEKKEKMTLAVPKTTLKVVAGKKYITAKWAKKSVTGYQLQYGLKSNFKSAKTLTLKSATKISQKINKLKSKKKYYVRIRCYTNAYDTTYCSGWVAKAVVVK